MFRITALSLFISVSVLVPRPAHGQQLDGMDSITYLAYLRSAKQFSEFVDRFNADSYEIPDLDENSSTTLDRRQSILMLFYRADPRFDRDAPQYSQSYEEKVLAFTDEIVEQEILINKHSKQVVAVAAVKVSHGGQDHTVQIRLQQEIDEPNLVRWVISDVDGPLLEIPQRDTSVLRFLSPVSHEMGFMDLRSALQEPKAAINYTREDFDYSPLSVFLHALYEGTIVFEEIGEVEWELHLREGMMLKIGERQVSAHTYGFVIYDLIYN